MMRHIAAGILLLTVAAAALAPSLTLAQSAAPEGLKSGFTEVLGKRGDLGVRSFGSISEFILTVLAVVGAVIAVLALGSLLYGAVLYIASLGDEGKTETAKKVIMYAIIGLLVLGAAGIAVNVVINIIKK